VTPAAPARRSPGRDGHRPACLQPYASQSVAMPVEYMSQFLQLFIVLENTLEYSNQIRKYNLPFSHKTSFNFGQNQTTLSLTTFIDKYSNIYNTKLVLLNQ
jgi:hypothetical protein